MAKPWTRDDTLLTLSSYLGRPSGMSLPPLLERQRLAAMLRRELPEINSRYHDFEIMASGGEGDKHIAALWKKFGTDPLACGIAADEVLQSRRRVPHHLRKRMAD
jgi:hypothetical protein